MNNSKRIVFLDYARVFTAFLVVFAHVYPVNSQVRLYVYAFHMPLFFIISGFLHSPKTSSTQLQKYIRTLFVPSLFFILFGVIMSLVFFKGNIINLSSKIIENVALRGNVPGNGTVWFLFALLNVKTVMYLYLKVSEKVTTYFKLLFLLGLLFCIFFGIRMLLRTPLDPFFIKQTLMAFPLYFLGYYTRKLYNKGLLSSPSNWTCIMVAVALLVLCVLITKVNGRVSMNGFSFGHFKYPLNILLFYVNGVIGSLMVIFISLMLRKENRLITLTANALISILGFQVPLMCAIHCFEIGGNYLISSLLSIFIITVCVILNQLIMRVCPELLGKKR